MLSAPAIPQNTMTGSGPTMSGSTSTKSGYPSCMADLRGLLGLAFVLLVAIALSKHRRGISWRTVGAALALQIGFAFLVLSGVRARTRSSWVSDRVQSLIGYADEGTTFVFGPLTEVGEEDETIFALRCCR